MSPSAAFAAIAASTALPPRFRISSPTWVASGCEVATMPCVAMISERVANALPVMRSAAAAGVAANNTASSTPNAFIGFPLSTVVSGQFECGGRANQSRAEIDVRTARGKSRVREQAAIPGRPARDEADPVSFGLVARGEDFEERESFEQVAETGQAA